MAIVTILPEEGSGGQWPTIAPGMKSINQPMFSDNGVRLIAGRMPQVKTVIRLRWYYFPEMQMDEALLIKTFESAANGRASGAGYQEFAVLNAI